MVLVSLLLYVLLRANCCYLLVFVIVSLWLVCCLCLLGGLCLPVVVVGFIVSVIV